MKRILIILPFLAILSLTKAQGLENFRIGLVFSNAILFPSSDNVDIKSKASYDFDYGIMLDYFFSTNYAISTGVYMDHSILARSNTPILGSLLADTAFANKFNISEASLSANERITSMNISVPISFKLKTNEIGYFRYFGDVGVLNSFRIQSRYSLEDTDLQKAKFGKRNDELNNENYFTKLYNLSLKVGGGIEWTISDKTALVVGLYFYNGFLDHIEDGDGKPTYLRKLSLRTGILF